MDALRGSWAQEVPSLFYLKFKITLGGEERKSTLPRVSVNPLFDQPPIRAMRGKGGIFLHSPWEASELSALSSPLPRSWATRGRGQLMLSVCAGQHSTSAWGHPTGPPSVAPCAFWGLSSWFKLGCKGLICREEPILPATYTLGSHWR